MSRDYLSIALICLALCAICIGWLVSSGCNQGKYAAHDAATLADATPVSAPSTQPQDATSPAPSAAAWSSAYDAPWASVTACWGYAPARPSVIVRAETHDFVDEWGRKVHGYFLAPSTVVVASDLAALEHELSEYVCWSKTGAYCHNTRGGCFDVI